MEWVEELPKNCPPEEAASPNRKKFYRLCKNRPPKNTDFLSQRTENPTRTFAGISECILRSVSIWESKQKCLEQKKFPTQKDKLLAEFELKVDDGLILSTFKDSHYSWWRSKSFNPKKTLIIEN